METYINKEYKSEIYTTGDHLNDAGMTFEVYGQTTERSCEDRSVYFDFKFKDNESDKRQITGWLNGEEAIELGQLLIKHGTNAMVANMVNHQRIHLSTRIQKYISEGRVTKLIFTAIDKSPKNYGQGFILFEIIPVWKKKKAPKYYEDFKTQEVIYWSPFSKEFNVQLNGWNCPIEFREYDHDKEKVVPFYNSCPAQG